jgi:flagellar biosynthesis protein FliQ
MTQAEIFEICHDAIYVLIIVAAPSMLAALIIGLIISLFQAVTQIQEATLTFVPKILTVFLVLAIAMPFMLHSLTDLTMRINEKIAQLE